jgi:pimeloyl-ACP methyl ester carboxylesterase
MLKWIRRVLFGTAVLVVVAVGMGVVYEQTSQRSVAREFPPVGQLVEHGGKRSHLFCIGEGSPTVILEGGLSVGGSQDWANIQPEIAADTRVCSYDRAGILWSEPREEPRDAHRIAEELHALLEAASELPPYVMVGHSLGGLLVRVYDDRFPGEVAGFVFIDASHPEQFDRYPPEVLEARSNLESSLPPPLLIRLLAVTGVYRRFMLSRPDNPIAAFLPRTVPWGFSGEMAARAAMSEQAAAAGNLDSRPVAVLTAGERPRMPGVTEEALDEYHGIRLALHAELAALSTNSDQRTIEGAGHNIYADKPEAVIAGVRDVVSAVRQDTSLQAEAGSQRESTR